MASASNRVALLVKKASLHNAANRAACETEIRQGDEGRTVGSSSGVFVWK